MGYTYIYIYNRTILYRIFTSAKYDDAVEVPLIVSIGTQYLCGH